MTDSKSEQRSGWSLLILSRSGWNWANTGLGPHYKEVPSKYHSFNFDKMIFYTLLYTYQYEDKNDRPRDDGTLRRV